MRAAVFSVTPTAAGEHEGEFLDTVGGDLNRRTEITMLRAPGRGRTLKLP
ncbi:hypothetical protein CLV56_3907 [Mumia flava]|uniref:Uncharacterized protein n=1 Tax=Mumia flava TaxID=1348852 RepID=A0A2M9B8Z9_9ACTN|nr:hypothetical protein [Mumia flava]PJJ54397.1 hypothetical protein CLV56_3907 [Mumia flava]